MKPRVVVVGSYVQDLSWKCASFPRPGETTVGAFVSGPGGKGSNQAVATGRLGVATLFVGAVGQDALGRDARAFYRAEGIAARLAVKPRHPTATAGILVDAEGRNQIVLDLAANLALVRADVPIAAVRAARVVVAQLESNLATTAWVLREARKAGVTTILNTAPLRADFDPAMLRHVDIVVPNDIEFAALVNRVPATGVRDFTEARRASMKHTDLHALCRTIGVPTVIITLGEKGCYVSTGDGFAHLPAHKVRAVDTTGAGDAFIGGLAAGLARGGSIFEAARMANAVAALSVTRPGTAPSMPTARELAKFLRTAR
ncbi:MAG TPA: ribokinase [Opitutaceae bacterium]|nr:ribokinase [Opitutaceae bacterium]